MGNSRFLYLPQFSIIHHLSNCFSSLSVLLSLKYAQFFKFINKYGSCHKEFSSFFSFFRTHKLFLKMDNFKEQDLKQKILHFINLGFTFSEIAKALCLSSTELKEIIFSDEEFKKECFETWANFYAELLKDLRKAAKNGSVSALKFLLSHRFESWEEKEGIISKFLDIPDEIEEKLFFEEIKAKENESSKN